MVLSVLIIALIINLALAFRAGLTNDLSLIGVTMILSSLLGVAIAYVLRVT